MDLTNRVNVMDGDPTVTVMIPTKDIQETILDCIKSVLSIDYPPEKLEILVLDASSPPLTLHKNFKDRVAVFNGDYSAPAAYNSVLPLVKGEIVALIDSDAIADRAWLRQLLKGFTDQQVGAVGGHIKTWNSQNPLARSIGYELEGRYLRMPNQILRISTSNLAIRKEILVRLGGFDETLQTGYDAKLGLDVNRLGYMVAFNPAAVVYHHHRPSLGRFFHQQRAYALHDVTLYLKGFPIRSDNVTSPWMLAELVGWLLAAALGLATLMTALVWNAFAAPAAFSFFSAITFLVASLILRGLRTAVAQRDPVVLVFYPVMLATRVVAWVVGGFEGLIRLARGTHGA